MARRIVSTVTYTPTAFADAAAMTSATYSAILAGASATQQTKVHEISISGQAASSSSPTFMILSRDATLAATNSLSGGQNDVSMDPSTAALGAPVLTGSTNTTGPGRSSTGHLMNCSLNAFGGVYFWRANKWDECATIVGNTTPLGEVSLSAYTGGTPGAIGSHIIYETL